MKTVVKVILIISLVIISIAIAVVGNGYEMYKEALEITPLEERVANIRKDENYTRIEEVPTM